MKLFFQSLSRSKQVGPLHVKSQVIKTNIPTALKSQGFSLKSIKMRQFQTKSGDLTMILRKF